ncbi:hypothetical protein BDV93DRAFT_559110 [Ceratobasidium sp. AG-I]|nr:hypothetical protein BDV93DRAFT_559110 [Ceratobasidium sp. AG-I]
MKLLSDMLKHKENGFSIAIGMISDYCHESIAVVPVVDPAAEAPMREWSPDVAEPYVNRYPDELLDHEMDREEDNEGFAQPWDGDDDNEQPKAGPSRHGDARVPEDDEFLTDLEMEEDVDVKPYTVKYSDDEQAFD